MVKILVRIEDSAAHPAPVNDNSTMKTLGVLVAVIVRRLTEGRA
jgi:hypothetical protein